MNPEGEDRVPAMCFTLVSLLEFHCNTYSSRRSMWLQCYEPSDKEAKFSKAGLNKQVKMGQKMHNFNCVHY